MEKSFRKALYEDWFILLIPLYMVLMGISLLFYALFGVLYSLPWFACSLIIISLMVYAITGAKDYSLGGAR
jgi:hypothetical protein